jgi:cytidylate kinase
MALVSFSRQEGSRGGLVARDVADRLGYRVLDLKALREAAETYGGIKRSAPELDERPPALFERLDRERRRYNVVLRAVVYDAALEDNVVFLGRGVGMLLGEFNHAFRVLVIAPLESRIQRVMTHGVSARPGPKARAEAEEIVRRTDRNRAGYFRYLFDVDWLDNRFHDLVINSDNMEVPAITETVVAALQRRDLTPTPATLERLNSLARAAREEAAQLTPVTRVAATPTAEGAPASLFKVAMERGASDPQSWAKQGNCRIVSHNSSFRRTDLVLIETDPGRVQEIVRLPGVHSVEQVVNESFRGDDGWTLTIKNGGVSARSRQRK